jgi:N-acyl-L-homoserine lactone synthetase
MHHLEVHMAKIESLIATSPKQVRASLRMRWTVFGKEMGYLPAVKPPASMEFDRFDGLATTKHFLVVAKKGGDQ